MQKKSTRDRGTEKKRKNFFMWRRAEIFNLRFAVAAAWKGERAQSLCVPRTPSRAQK